MVRQIYFDNASTTRVDERVMKVVNKFMREKYGNASSVHTIGQEAKKALENARHIIAKSINANDNEIYFTSGGTEANNWAIKGAVWKTGKKHIITSRIDHDSVLNTCKWLEENFGVRVTYLNVDKDGFVDLGQLKKEITKDTAIVSIIHGNNEIGTIQDLEEIGKICRERGVLFHTDACQSYTKTEIDVTKIHVDLIALNSHKIHGPKGVGALYIRNKIRDKIEILMHGGGHERKMRSGTENVPGIVGFAKAVEIAKSRYVDYMIKLRDRLIDGIEKHITNVRLNGPRGKKRLCNNINISFNNIEGEAVVGMLNSYRIYSSTGSACSSHSLEPSHVLKAIGLSDLQANSSIRLSLSRENSEEEVDEVIKILVKVVNKLRKISPFS